MGAEAPDMTSAGGLRRSLAVFVDFLVFFAIWIAIGLVAPTGSVFYTLALFLVVDVVLTAFFGLSPGRFAAGIRVVRATAGGPPGLLAALIRTGLVVISGWLGLFLYLLSLRYLDRSPQRMWWDAAARTRLVLAARATT